MKRCPCCGKKISEYALNCPFCNHNISAQDRGGAGTAELNKIRFAEKSTKDIILVVTFATIGSIIALYFWNWITAQFYGVWGETVQSAFVAVGQSISTRIILLLILGAAAYFIVIKLLKNAKVIGITIVTALFAIIQMWVLSKIRAYNYNMAVYLFTPYLFKMFAFVSGIGLPILQGTLCVVSLWSNTKKSLRYMVIVFMVYIVVAVLGSFIGIRLLEQGIMGGMGAICGAVAAVVATVIIALRQQHKSLPLQTE